MTEFYFWLLRVFVYIVTVIIQMSQTLTYSECC